MVQLLHQPPPAAAIARMAAVEGVAFTPGVLGTQQGPDRHLGPEGAGAILVLQATFVDGAGFDSFWVKAAELMELLVTAPGFIRRISFADGPHYTLIGFWRTLADAHSFFSRDEHQAAMQELYRDRWQYTHFAGLWEVAAPRQRVIFCQVCDGITPSTDHVCVGCGTELFDPYATLSHVDH